MRSIILTVLIASALAGPVEAYDWCPKGTRDYLARVERLTVGTRWVDRHNCIRFEKRGEPGRILPYFHNDCGVWIFFHYCYPPGTERYELGIDRCLKPNTPARDFLIKPGTSARRGPGVTWWAVSCE